MNLIPDTSSLLPAGNNIATLRLYMAFDETDYLVVQDFAENSIWAGLAAIGGLWTIIEGIFALIFGCSILFIICGMHPLPPRPMFVLND